MRIKVYASLSPEMMFEKGKAAGLNDEAANYFSYFREIELVLTVDTENGTVLGAEVTEKF